MQKLEMTETTIGPWGEKDTTINDNGNRLLDIYTTLDFVTGGTLFPHRDVQWLKGYFPNRKDKNQVDNLMINGMWRRSLPRLQSEKRS